MAQQHPHVYKCLGAEVSKRRRKLGISQGELAESAGVDRGFISNVENGSRNPSFGTVLKIAEGLKMRYARLVHNCEKCIAEQKTS